MIFFRYEFRKNENKKNEIQIFNDQKKNGGSNLNLTRSTPLLFSALIILLTLSTLCSCYVLVPLNDQSLPVNPFNPNKWIYSRLKRQLYSQSSPSFSSPEFSPTKDYHHVTDSHLSINVRNNGGEVFTESIYSNAKQNYVRFEFVDTDGTRVKHLADFANNVTITHVVRLGEEDLHEPRVRTYCFVTRLLPNEYIEPEAMAKLTQNNPWATRQAELDHGSLQFRMDLTLSPAHCSLLSPHLPTFCSLSNQIEIPIYADQRDLQLWTSGNRSYHNLTTASVIQKLDHSENLSNSSTTSNTSIPQRCDDLLRMLYQNISSSSNLTSSNFTQLFHSNPNQVCLCSVSLVLPFNPCSIKYCPQPDPSNPQKMIQTRCGIRTCRRRYEFMFAVPDKLVCLSDFDPTENLVQKV